MGIVEDSKMCDGDVDISLKHYNGPEWGIVSRNEINGLVIMLEGAIDRYNHKIVGEPIDVNRSKKMISKLNELINRKS